VLTPDAASRDTSTKTGGEGSVPRYQAHLRTYIDLPFNLEASGLGYRVAALPAMGVPAYTRVDLRLGWMWRDLDVAVGAQNLGHGGQPEFAEQSGVMSSRSCQGHSRRSASGSDLT
jgi:iron complex outermembrane receptor protein